MARLAEVAGYDVARGEQHGRWMYLAHADQGFAFIPGIDAPLTLADAGLVLTWLAKATTEVTIYDGGKQVCVHYDIPSGDRTVEDVEWGQRVCCAAELRPGITLELDELKEWARARLAPHKIPKDLACVAQLPRNAMGKVVKPEVATFFARPAQPARPAS